MREIFSLTIQKNGDCFLYLRTPTDRQAGVCGAMLNDEDNPLIKSGVTKQLLSMLAEAYYAGYTEAVNDSTDAVDRLMLESSQHRKPNIKIHEKNDYRKL